MRKRTIARTLQTPPLLEQGWFDLESIASVEITSEDPAFPIESALVRRNKGGWLAAEPGVQTIRLIFDEPQKLRRISLIFEETETKRTQEREARQAAQCNPSSRSARKSCGTSHPRSRHRIGRARRSCDLILE
jgi:hypothetical protein